MNKWELVLNPPECGSDPVKVTAKCSSCGAPMFDNPAVLGWHNTENGTVLWCGFITDYRYCEETAKRFAFNCAESVKWLLPKFCSRCGERMI